MGKFYGTAILEFVLYASIYLFYFCSFCSLIFELVVALQRLHGLESDWESCSEPARDEASDRVGVRASFEGLQTTRCAYKIYFVNKVNAITNKLDFVPCFLYFVAGSCIFGHDLKLKLELVPPLGNRSTAPRGAPMSPRLCCA